MLIYSTYLDASFKLENLSKRFCNLNSVYAKTYSFWFYLYELEKLGKTKYENQSKNIVSDLPSHLA
jgi:hypothetical protein